MRTWRRRKENLSVFSLYAKRYKSVYISVNNNTNLNLFKILSNYIIWDRLSQKTISCYYPFNPIPRHSNNDNCYLPTFKLSSLCGRERLCLHQPQRGGIKTIGNWNKKEFSSFTFPFSMTPPISNKS
jgi:hypothetical protein